MIEQLIEKFIVISKKYIGGLMGFAFGYIFITRGFGPMLVVMITTSIGIILGDKEYMTKIKRSIINRLKEE
jgi:uncharacterized membrane protein